ncbi:MAG: hypothetical protein QMD71_06340 [bacterium]|nr:hypothetical protein [bacterium]
MAKPLGYSTRCKVCNSPNRDKIEQWMLEGVTLVDCVDRVKKELKESIGRTSIWKHMREHFVDKDTIKQVYADKKTAQEYGEKKDKVDLAYEKSKLLKSQYIDKNLSEIEKLDDMIETDYAMYKRTAELMADKLKQKIAPKPLADFLKVLNTNINTSLKTKAELLGTDAEGRKASVMETWIDLVASMDEDTN